MKANFKTTNESVMGLFVALIGGSPKAAPPSSIPAQIAALQAQVATLQGQVGSLQSSNIGLQIRLSILPSNNELLLGPDVTVDRNTENGLKGTPCDLS
jgi:hypothetical protein